MPRRVFHLGTPIWRSARSCASERPSAEPCIAGVDQFDAVPERVTYVAAQDAQPAVILPDLDAGGRESFADERDLVNEYSTTPVAASSSQRTVCQVTL